jgi:hypothetical protein
MLHEYHVIHSIRYYPRFHITAVGVGTYYPLIRGHYCSLFANAAHEHCLYKLLWREIQNILGSLLYTLTCSALKYFKILKVNNGNVIESHIVRQNFTSSFKTLSAFAPYFEKRKWKKPIKINMPILGSGLSFLQSDIILFRHLSFITSRRFF